jgi:hypothetical protein
MNDRDYFTPEQEAHLSERSKQIDREFSLDQISEKTYERLKKIEQEFRNKAPERARVAEETKRTMETRDAAERPLTLERSRQLQKDNDQKKENVIRDWLEMNPTFIKNDKTTMIPKGKQFATLAYNNVNIVPSPRDLYSPNFYLGNEIVAVERSGGRKTKRRRCRKSKKSKQN